MMGLVAIVVGIDFLATVDMIRAISFATLCVRIKVASISGRV